MCQNGAAVNLQDRIMCHLEYRSGADGCSHTGLGKGEDSLYFTFWGGGARSPRRIRGHPRRFNFRTTFFIPAWTRLLQRPILLPLFAYIKYSWLPLSISQIRDTLFWGYSTVHNEVVDLHHLSPRGSAGGGGPGDVADRFSGQISWLCRKYLI